MRGPLSEREVLGDAVAGDAVVGDPVAGDAVAGDARVGDARVRGGVHGQVAPGLEAVRAAFVDNFIHRGELGASLCVYRQGERVVDLWGGVADAASGRPFEADTLAIVFSATKGVVALALNQLAEAGRIDFDGRVADLWPEFAAAGKADLTFRTLFEHRGGLNVLDRPLKLDDFGADPTRVEAALAAQTPRWTPGAEQGYHATTYGMYAQAVFRRAAGETVGAFIARRVAAPVGADVFLGLPESLEPRVARTYRARTQDVILRALPAAIRGVNLEGRVFRQALRRGTDTQGAFGNPAELGPRGIARYDSRRVRALELPWCNAVASARGLAAIYGALATGGGPLLRPETVDALRPRGSWSDMDRVLRKPMGWTRGFVKEETHLFSPNPATFGHPGAGGALGWCDPDAGLAIGYVPNRMSHEVRSSRALAICHALYRCL